AIWVAAPEAVDALPASVRGKTVVTGAPIDAPNRWRQPQARLHFGLTDGKPVVVITGGSQGSLAINRLVAEWLQQGGGANVNVIWSTGRATHAEFAGLHRPPGVQVLPFIDPMADAWAAAWLVVARAGMMTLAEVCAWGLPSILIPLPTAAADHQRYNARAMAAAGASRVFEQRGLTAATLGGAIEALAADGDALFQMGHAASLRGRPEAAVTIADAVVKLAGGNAPAV
ncbi:MAG TPA: UDP-N-acetylglucosamine--N-acetylmuramyl-(pentapeptide) pyrophosphoryl-undecaprenol N-acetylglucosamine transferase, partial [Gemmatimonadales bacterium]|nr:UDP-N-acetylglucosamine--N-acetylmuramyl-(pentapeptide) pyrophosphoryl-undecaprenol N-acetylglucosamine transferase [Gemmatimonadales bacterium]